LHILTEKPILFKYKIYSKSFNRSRCKASYAVPVSLILPGQNTGLEIPNKKAYKMCSGVKRRADNSNRSPRNRRPWTSSGPEGSSDKWSPLCRGSIPVLQLSVRRLTSVFSFQPPPLLLYL